MKKTYLGDGLYAEFDGFQIRVFASNGISESDSLYFDGSAIKALVEFAKEVEELSR